RAVRAEHGRPDAPDPLLVLLVVDRVPAPSRAREVGGELVRPREGPRRGRGEAVGELRGEREGARGGRGLGARGGGSRGARGGRSRRPAPRRRTTPGAPCPTRTCARRPAGRPW